MRDAYKHRNRYLASGRANFWKINEIPFLCSKSYHLKIYFTTDLIITKLSSNHPSLKYFISQNIFPRTLYRIINLNKHQRVLSLLFLLRYHNKRGNKKTFLQLNSSSIVGNAELKVIETKKKYCLSLSGIKIDNTHTLLDTYLSIPKYYKETTYQIYDVLHETPLENLKSIAAILKDNNISDSNFYKFFKKTIGSSPSKILTDRKLINFIFYLIETDKVIDEYFHQFGFKDKSTLYRNFNEVFGIPPKKFKQLHNKRKHK